MSSEAVVSASILSKPHQNKTRIKILKAKVYNVQAKNILTHSYWAKYSTSLKMTEVVLSFSRKH